MSCCTPCCPPSCVIPSCLSKPHIGLGGCGIGSPYGGYGSGSGGGGSGVPASSLGVLSGVIPSSISQIPSSEVMIQPPPVVVTIPGPILSASCDPVSVGGYSGCASGRFYPSSPGLLGAGSRGICAPRRKYSICRTPC